MSGLARLAAIAAPVAVLAAGGTAGARAAGTADAGKAETAAWDQVATIKGAAERLGRLHRAKGAKAAYDLIDACYRTHGLASSYGEGFEICITQDYLETRTLMKVYSRMPPEVLEKLGVPSPQELARSMGERISAAFGRYGKSQAYSNTLKGLIDEHGFPVFLAIVFPEAAGDGKAQEKSRPR